jgi:hypothetical protein
MDKRLERRRYFLAVNRALLNVKGHLIDALSGIFKNLLNPLRGKICFPREYVR